MSFEGESMTRALKKAFAKAEACAQDWDLRAPTVAPTGRLVAMGDPQTGTRRLLEGLAAKGLLGQEGWLREEVRLIVLGDYFDFGPALERRETGEEGLRNLAWLAAHSEDQITLLAGNHDLARVGELLGLTDASFEEAHEAACRLYPPACDGREPSDEEVAEFLGAYPSFPTVEVAARDLSSFLTAQRDLILLLLKTKRLRLATARDKLLFCHAGITNSDLAAAGFSDPREPDASELAAFLNSRLDEALHSWSQREALSIAGLHQPGSAKTGEGGGILFHRPQYPDGDRTAFCGPQRRRYDPQELPRGVIQVVGHIGDQKCRQLLRPWVKDGEPAVSGALRHLKLGKDGPAYRLGAGTWSAGDTGLLFVDGGMNRSSPKSYEFLDVLQMTVWKP